MRSNICFYKFNGFTDIFLQKKNMNIIHILIFIVYLNVQNNLINAIYQDEAGVLDWKVKNYGIISKAILTNSNVYVGTESGMIASLNLDDGSLLWRIITNKVNTISKSNKLYQENDNMVTNLKSNNSFRSSEITSLILSPNKMRLYAISSDKMVRCIYSSNGNIIWDAPVDESSLSIESSFSSLVFNHVESSIVYIESRNHVVSRSESDGKLLYRWKSPNDYEIDAILSLGGGYIWVILVSVKDSSVVITMASKDTYEESTMITLCDKGCHKPVISKLSDSKLSSILCISEKTLKSLVIPNFKEDAEEDEIHSILSSSIRSTEIYDLLYDENIVVDMNDLILTNDMILKSNEKKVLISVHFNGRITKLRSVSSDGILAQIQNSPSSPLIVSLTKEALSVTHADLKIKDKLHVNTLLLDPSEFSGPAKLAFSYRHSSDQHHHLLIVTKGGIILLVDIKTTEAKILWSSDQSLSQVTQADFFLREETEEYENGNSDSTHNFIDLSEFTMKTWSLRLRSQLKSIMNLIVSFKNLIHPKFADVLSNAVELETSGKASLFGFHQTIVVITKTGRILGLASESGNVIWTDWLDVSSMITLKKLNDREALFVHGNKYQIRNVHTGEITHLSSNTNVSMDKDVNVKTVIQLPKHILNEKTMNNDYDNKSDLFFILDDSYKATLISFNHDKIVEKKENSVNMNRLKSIKNKVHWIEVSKNKQTIEGKLLREVSGKPLTLWSKVIIIYCIILFYTKLTIYNTNKCTSFKSNRYNIYYLDL